MQSKISVYYRLEQCKVTAHKVTAPLLLHRTFNVSVMKSTFNHIRFHFFITDKIYHPLYASEKSVYFFGEIHFNKTAVLN